MREVVIAWNMGGTNFRRRGKPTVEAKALAAYVLQLTKEIKFLKKLFDMRFKRMYKDGVGQLSPPQQEKDHEIRRCTCH